MALKGGCSVPVADMMSMAGSRCYLIPQSPHSRGPVPKVALLRGGGTFRRRGLVGGP
jgi:hypothetical protein